MERYEKPPVYCICDRNVDGLVDTMSHLLHSELTNVVAMPVPRCNYTALSWDANGDYDRQRLFEKQIKYLGNGLELAAIAIKNQIPKVTWYSETKAPVRDIRWISGQYYATICRYMNLPAQQKSLYEKIDFVSNLWSLPISDEQFVIAEDEFCNIFSSMRAYLTRGASNAFVNVMSENYLLRDYMRCNQQMFTSDPNAIPSLVPDYAKTERNTILKLVIVMTYRPVSEEEILDEFRLVGIETNDVIGKMTELLRKYTQADDSIFTIHGVKSSMDDLTSMTSCAYSISEENFDRFFVQSLHNAYYIVEDENVDEEYIDARLFSHVTQTILPGQFVTYDGKYYQVKHISPKSGVILRRASDLYEGRRYYRQVREYQFDSSVYDEIISCRTITDIEIASIRRSFQVNTSGYLDMRDYHDLRTARMIDLSNDPFIQNLTRRYQNKTVLRIRFPEMDEKMRFTTCLLLSEIIRSVFPNSYQYLAVIAKNTTEIEGMLNYVVYRAEGDVEDDCIYIVEDSDLDLGLLSAVERSFLSLIEIMADFVEWHIEKMREPAAKDPVPTKKTIAQIHRQEERKRSLFVRMAERIRKLFGGKKEKEVVIDDKEVNNDDSITENPDDSSNADQTVTEQGYSLDEQEVAESTPTEEPIEDTSAPEYSLDEADKSNDFEESCDLEDVSAKEEDADNVEIEDGSNSEIVDIDGTDIFDNDSMPDNPYDMEYFESQFKAMGIMPITQTRYQQECYLKYGFSEVDSRIEIDEIHRYLRVRGFCDNDLTKARKREVLAEMDIDLSAENHCDFCGLPLNGVSFDRLNDGRIRCNDCSASAITTVEDFRELFSRCLSLMEDFYDIRYRVPISVQMTDAKTIAKGAGTIFRPTNGVAPRVLGYAQRKRGKYSLLIENGSPRLAAIDTMIHEMTHIWQYLNWNDREIQELYQMGKPSCSSIANDIVYEGMAMWAAIQYLYQIGETYYATQQEAMTAARDDVSEDFVYILKQGRRYVDETNKYHYHIIPYMCCYNL